MNLEVGKSYIVDTVSANGRTQLYGKLIHIQREVLGSRFTGYTFSDCVVKTEDGEIYNVSNNVNLFNTNMFGAVEVEPMIEAMIYALSQRNPNVMDADTVEQLVSTVTPELATYPFRNPERTAINIHGDNEEDIENPNNGDHVDYGGSKRKSARRRSTKRLSKKHRSKKRRT